MLAVVKYHDLDLSVYDEGTPIVYGNLHDNPIPDGPEPFFVRDVSLIAPGFRSLGKALRAADELFDKAAEECGATVIEHYWGFAPRRPGTAPDWRTTGLVPPEFELVAKVERIRDPANPTPDQKRTIEACRDVQGSLPSGELRWSDYDHDQFSNGRTASQPQLTLTLHDIEPILTRC